MGERETGSGLVDLASARLGGTVLSANDEFFAPKESLIEASDPISRPGVYTDRGKWMDGWETRRRRTPGHDWCILRLGAPGIIREVVVDTAHFRGNYPESCSLEGAAVEEDPDEAQLRHPSTRWVEILPRSPLEGDARNEFPIDAPYRFTHLRFNIFPDGGVARLRVHGEVLPDPTRLVGEVDLAAAVNGTVTEDCSDMFFCSPENLLMPGDPVDMGDGWETRRRRGPGHDWVVIRLAGSGTVDQVVVDTTHFKGNHPESCSLELRAAEGDWREALSRRPLGPDAVHRFTELSERGPTTHVRFNTFPDGGVARLRLLGSLTEEGLRDLRLRHLNALLPEAAAEELLACCGSQEWARRVAEARPFPSPEELLEAADRIWWELDEDEWREAFAAHPPIGGRKDDQPGQEAAWSEQEQAGTASAAREVLDELAEGNRAYQDRFGHVFIVCATGKTAREMLDLLRERLDNPPEEEMRVAAEEQRKITRLRLEKLIGPPETASEGGAG